MRRRATAQASTCPQTRCFFLSFPVQMLIFRSPWLDPQQKVIVFDDIKLDNMKKLMEYFSLSRNRNCNCIYLTQSYFNTPKYIRRNTNCFVFFGNLDNKDIRHITDNHAKGITKEEMESIYREATKDPYNFMVLDKTAKHLPLRYRKCFDHFWA